MTDQSGLELDALLADLDGRRKEIDARGSAEAQTFGLLFGTFAVLIAAIVTANLNVVASLPGISAALPSGFLAVGVIFMWFPINNAHQWLETRTAARYLTNVVVPRIREVVYGPSPSGPVRDAAESLLSWEQYREEHVYKLAWKNLAGFPIGFFRAALVYVPSALALGYYELGLPHLAGGRWVGLELTLLIVAWVTFCYPALLVIFLQLRTKSRIVGS